MHFMNEIMSENRLVISYMSDWLSYWLKLLSIQVELVLYRHLT